MKNQKSKIISFVLVFALLITTIIVTSVANAKAVDIYLESDKTELLAGESATISVKVTTNFSVATMSIPVFYDKTLVDVSEATATLTGYAVANTTTESQSVDTEKVYENTEIDSDKFGFVLVTYIGGANKEVAESIENEVVLTFKITAKTDVSGNAAVKVIQESAKTSENIKGMLYFGATTNGPTINSIPENIEKIDLTTGIVSVKIGKLNNLPTLEVKTSEEFEYSDYVILDKTNTNNGEYTGIIYGIDTLDQNEAMEILGSLGDALMASTGDETQIEIIANEAGQESTDALIEIVDSEGTVLETYVFIYFGDVDGDAMISANDAFIAEYYEGTYEGINTYAQYVACDIDGDGMPSANDAFVMEYYEGTYEGVDYQYNIGQNAVNNSYEWIY